MNGNPREEFNSLDPEFLLSERIDRALSEAEQPVLDDALASQPDLQRTARSYECLNALLRAWAENCPARDADAFERRVREAVRSEPDPPGIDAKLAHWAGSAPVPSADDFVASVRAEILSPQGAPAGGETRRPIRFPWMRLGAPLAAAAAIVLLLSLRSADFGGIRNDRVSRSSGSAQLDPTGEALPQTPGVSFVLDRSRGTRVAFDRTAVAASTDEEISFIAIGVAGGDDESYLEG